MIEPLQVSLKSWEKPPLQLSRYTGNRRSSTKKKGLDEPVLVEEAPMGRFVNKSAD